MLYVEEGVPSKMLKPLRNDKDGRFLLVDINFRKEKVLLIYDYNTHIKFIKENLMCFEYNIHNKEMSNVKKQITYKVTLMIIVQQGIKNKKVYIKKIEQLNNRKL